MTINNLTESIHKSNVVEDDWVEIDEVFNLESSAGLLTPLYLVQPNVLLAKSDSDRE